MADSRRRGVEGRERKHGNTHATRFRETDGCDGGDAVVGRAAGKLRERRGREAGRRRDGRCGRQGLFAGYRLDDHRIRAGRRLRPDGVVGLRRARSRAADPVHADHHRCGPQLQERPRHVLRSVRRRHDLDVHRPRRREVHRRHPAHSARRGLHHQRHLELGSIRVRHVHGERGRGHRRRHRRRAHGEAVQRAAVHAGRGGHRARARLRRHVRRQPHRLGALHAGAVGQRPAGHPQGEPRLLRRGAEHPARRGSVHGRGRLACGGEVRTGRRCIHLGDVRGSAAERLRLAELRVGRLSRHLAAGDSGGRHENRREGRSGGRQRCHVRPGHSPSHQLRRRPRQDDRQRAERLRHRGLQRGRRHAVVLARHEVLHRCREGEEAARRRRLDGRCGRHPREGRHARCVQPVLLGRRHRAPRYRRGVHQPDERAGHRSIHQGRQLGRSVPASVYRSGGVGLGHERAHRDLQPVLLQGHGQLRLLHERNHRQVSRRGAGPAYCGRVVRSVEEGSVGRPVRHRAAGGRAVGVVREHRPLVLCEGQPQDREAEASSARTRLVAGE